MWVRFLLEAQIPLYFSHKHAKMACMTTESDISEIKEIVEENNKMLKRLQTRARIASTINIVKWVVIIAVALGVYTFIQPFLSQVGETYSSIRDSAKTIQELKEKVPSTPNLMDFLNI
jgi:hypothetical protein